MSQKLKHNYIMCRIIQFQCGKNVMNIFKTTKKIFYLLRNNMQFNKNIDNYTL